MKTFLRNVLIFSVIAAPIYFILVTAVGMAIPKNYKYVANISYRPGELSTGHLRTRISEIPKTNDVDILIVGSSHAYRGFDPRIFKRHDINLFNLGSSAQSPQQSYFLLEEYLDTIDPKKVIFEVYPETFTTDGIEAATDLISNDNLSFRLVVHSLSYANIRVINTLLLRIFDQLILRSDRTESLTIRQDTYIPGGFVATEEGFFKPKEARDQQAFSFKEKQFEFLEKSVQLLKDRDIPYIFIQAPVTNILNASKPTPNFFGERLSKLGLYHNYQGELDLDDNLDFVDNDHLSQAGVEKFNEAVIRNDIYN